MLAALNRREPIYEASLPLTGVQTPHPVFEAAYRELCTRIWIELELLAQAALQIEPRPALDLEMTTAILRLELVVLVDSCRSPGWRNMLSAEQRDSLCAMLTDALAALYVEPDQLQAGIIEAQERVLDELQPQFSARTAAAADSLEAGEPEQASPAAVDELVNLIVAEQRRRSAPSL